MDSALLSLTQLRSSTLVHPNKIELASNLALNIVVAVLFSPIGINRWSVREGEKLTFFFFRERVLYKAGPNSTRKHRSGSGSEDERLITEK